MNIDAHLLCFEKRHIPKALWNDAPLRLEIIWRAPRQRKQAGSCRLLVFQRSIYCIPS